MGEYIIREAMAHKHVHVAPLVAFHHHRGSGEAHGRHKAVALVAGLKMADVQHTFAVFTAH
ncbi:hypothetical protein D3C75_1185300 [compost metagenome]